MITLEAKAWLVSLAMDFFNRDPVVHTSTYKLDKAA
jgi:hypothetical protein